MSPATPASGNNNNSKSSNNASPKNQKDVDFSTLPPNAPLPKYSAGGDPMRWTIQRRTNIDHATGEERAEYAIDIAEWSGEIKCSCALYGGHDMEKAWMRTLHLHLHTERQAESTRGVYALVWADLI